MPCEPEKHSSNRQKATKRTKQVGAEDKLGCEFSPDPHDSPLGINGGASVLGRTLRVSSAASP